MNSDLLYIIYMLRKRGVTIAIEILEERDFIVSRFARLFSCFAILV